MQKSEVLQTIAMIQTYYPSNHKLPTDEKSVSQLANAWLLMLDDVPYATVKRNLKEHVLTNKYPPTIADLCQISNKRTEDATTTQMRIATQSKPVQTKELVAAREQALRDLEALRKTMIFGGGSDE